MFREAKVTLMVADMDRSVKFYSEALGLRVRVRYGNEWVEVDAPGTIIALHPARKPVQKSPSGGMSIAFQVPDLDAAVAVLRERGVAFGRVVAGFVRQAHFSDPDGNPLYLAEVK